MNKIDLSKVVSVEIRTINFNMIPYEHWLEANKCEKWLKSKGIIPRRPSYLHNPSHMACIDTSTIVEDHQKEMISNYIEYFFKIGNVVSNRLNKARSSMKKDEFKNYINTNGGLIPSDLEQVVVILKQMVDDKKLPPGWITYMSETLKKENFSKRQNFCNSFNNRRLHIPNERGINFSQYYPSNDDFKAAKTEDAKKILLDNMGNYFTFSHPLFKKQLRNCNRIKYLSRIAYDDRTQDVINNYGEAHFAAMDHFLFSQYASLSSLYLTIPYDFNEEDLKVLRSQAADELQIAQVLGKIILNLHFTVSHDKEGNLIPHEPAVKRIESCNKDKNELIRAYKFNYFTPKQYHQYEKECLEIIKRLETTDFARKQNSHLDQKLNQQSELILIFSNDYIQLTVHQEIAKVLRLVTNPLLNFNQFLNIDPVKASKTRLEALEAILVELNKAHYRKHKLTKRTKDLDKIKSCLEKMFPEYTSAIRWATNTLTLRECINPSVYNDLLEEGIIYFKGKGILLSEEAHKYLILGNPFHTKDLKTSIGWFVEKAQSAKTLKDFIFAMYKETRDTRNTIENTIRKCEKSLNYDPAKDKYVKALRHLKHLQTGIALIIPEYTELIMDCIEANDPISRNLFKYDIEECELEFVEICIADRLLPVEEISIVAETISTKLTVEQPAPVVAAVEEVKELSFREEVEALYPGVFVDSDFERFSGISQSPEHKTWLERGRILRKVFEEIELTKSDKLTDKSKLNELKVQNAKAVDSLRPQVQEPLHTVDSNKFPWLVKENVTNLSPELQEVS